MVSFVKHYQKDKQKTRKRFFAMMEDMNYIFSKNKKGFTLIELLVVISVIGILSTIVSSALASARNKARLAAAQANAKSVETMFFAEEWTTDKNVFTMWFPVDNIGDINSVSPLVIDESGEGNHLLNKAAPGLPLVESNDSPTGKGKSMRVEKRGVFRSSVHGISNDPIDRVTIATWVKIKDIDLINGYPFIQFAGSTGLRVNSSKFCFYINAYNSICSTKKIRKDEWHYVVGSYNGLEEKMNLFVDGQLVATKENAPQTVNIDNRAFYVGTSRFDGWLDSVIVLPFAFDKGNLN